MDRWWAPSAGARRQHASDLGAVLVLARNKALSYLPQRRRRSGRGPVSELVSGRNLPTITGASLLRHAPAAWRAQHPAGPDAERRPGGLAAPKAPPFAAGRPRPGVVQASVASL
jgi:hypothetical protein